MKRMILVLMFTILAAGCGADKQHDNVAANGEVEAAPAAPVDPTPQRPTASDPWPNRDHTAPFQTMRFGETVVRVPTGYISLLNEANPAKGQNASLSLRTRVPDFPMHDEEEKMLEDNRKKGIKPSVYSRVFVDIGFAPQVKDDRTQFGEVFNEAQLLERYFYSRNNNVPLGPPVEFPELGLKRYTGKALPDRDFVYTPIDDKIREPNGELIVFTCDPVPSDLLSANALCSTGFKLTKDVGVGYMFPPYHLSRWKDIYKFVLNTVQIVK